MVINRLIAGTALLVAAAVSLGAQDSTRTSQQRIRVRKDVGTVRTTTTDTMTRMSTTMPMDTMTVDTTMVEWYYATPAAHCSTVDVAAAKAVAIKADMYNAATMISPDSAKILALCAVPGQIGGGELKTVDGKNEYAISIIPNKKKTWSKVIVDASTGAVLSSKQYGGLRGLAGWVRESADHKSSKRAGKP